MVKSNLSSALCRFITEVQKVDESEYPPNSLRDLVYGIQMHLETQKFYWKLLDMSDEEFVNVAMVLDNEMKDRVEKSMGVVQSATPILVHMEEKMWANGVLVEENPKQLSDTVMFLLGINLALSGGGGDHKKLRHPGFNEQIRVGTDSNGVKCLMYHSDPMSKTNKGGLMRKWFPLK